VKLQRGGAVVESARNFQLKEGLVDGVTIRLSLWPAWTRGWFTVRRAATFFAFNRVFAYDLEAICH
jgi:hypothetical protein